MAGIPGPAHLTEPVVAVRTELPAWARLLRAPNPGPMTLDGTNTWVLRRPGSPGAVVVDPGPADIEHLAMVAGCGPVELILITHGHPDHVEGLPWLRERCPHAPVVAGADACGRHDAAGLSITGLATPGHTLDSVSFLVESPGEDQSTADPAVLTGDTILGRGTTVVAYPDGDLGAYLTSLDVLAGLGAVAVLPGHGPALTDLGSAAGAYAAHRRARLDQVRAAVTAGAASATEVVAAVYPDLDPQVRRYAIWTVRAQLAYLGFDPT